MAIERKKTTVYVDSELIPSAKVLAAETGRHDYQVFEAALRDYLRSSERDRGRGNLQELLERPKHGQELTDDESLELAYSELKAVRQDRR